MPIIPERSSPINVNIMSALAPHRHGPFILKGVQPVIEVPIHTPVGDTPTEPPNQLGRFLRTTILQDNINRDPNIGSAARA